MLVKCFLWLKQSQFQSCGQDKSTGTLKMFSANVNKQTFESRFLRVDIFIAFFYFEFKNLNVILHDMSPLNDRD